MKTTIMIYQVTNFIFLNISLIFKAIIAVKNVLNINTYNTFVNLRLVGAGVDSVEHFLGVSAVRDESGTEFRGIGYHSGVLTLDGAGGHFVVHQS